MKNIQKKYDLVVIGAGPAGTPVAIEYAKLNQDKKVALVDLLGELGGECLFKGCIPSKIMEASATHIKELDVLEEFGVSLQSKHYELIWEKIKQRKEKILAKRTKSAKDVVVEVGNIDIIKGFAKFKTSNAVEICLENEQTEIVEFEKALIATGSKARTISYGGDAVKEVMTNDTFFKEMPFPKSLSIIGSGAIAIEFTQILANLGVEINLFVRGDKILKNIDKEASSYLLKVLQQHPKVKVILESNVEEINYSKDLLR